jgi:hypothetical protein
MAFGRVGVQQTLGRPAAYGRGELPAQIDRVAQAEVKALPAERRVDVRRVARRQYAAKAVRRRLPGVVGEARQRVDGGDRDVGAGHAPHRLLEFLADDGIVTVGRGPVELRCEKRMRVRRRAMLAHRDGARLAAGNRPTPDSWPRIERTLSVLVEAGFDPQDAVRAIVVLGHYVSGFVLDEQGDPEREDDAPPALDPGVFPHLAAGGTVVLDRDTLFEYGLQRMLDGMRAQISAVRPR